MSETPHTRLNEWVTLLYQRILCWWPWTWNPFTQSSNMRWVLGHLCIIWTNRWHDLMLIGFLEFILTHNYFVFDRPFFQQVSGTAMGAPSYANLLLGWWGETVVYPAACYQQYFWKWFTYIDDIIFIWTWPLEECHNFIDNLNNNDMHICPTSHLSHLPTFLRFFLYPENRP